MLLLLATAFAGELNFSPDRPGVGDATATAGAGAVLVEAGLAATFTNPSTIGTGGIVGRIGVHDVVELRVRAPDLLLVDGQLATGAVGLGGKVGGALDDHWAVSSVHEVLVDTSTGTVSGYVGAQLSYSVDAVGLWVHNHAVVVPGATGGFLGGGISYYFDPVGIYVNGGHGFNGDPLVGGGGWIALSDRAQLDAGVDATLVAGRAYPLALFGVSVGFD
jgi:hypothetical protein